MNQPRSLKGPFPKMMMGGRYVRAVNNGGQAPMFSQTPEVDVTGHHMRPTERQTMTSVQRPFRFDGNQFNFYSPLRGLMG